MIRLLSLTDLFPFLFSSLYSFQSAVDVNGEEEEEEEEKEEEEMSRRGQCLSFIKRRER
jgi:hypothetical protein